jgi:hypothetical protein
MTRTRPTVAWIAVLAWCAVAGWFAFARSQRVPLVAFANLGFHELGHLVMYVLPINEILTAAMGSIMQCAVPLGLAAYFGWYRRDLLPMVACLAWAATNFQEVAVYVADAPFQRLELIGGRHDWAFVLGPDGLDRMSEASRDASAVRGIGVLVLLGAAAVGVAGLWTAITRSASNGSDTISTPMAAPAAAREATPDDLFPTTSRTRSSVPARRNTRW